MATTLFDIAAEKLERNTDMDRLAARGTLRLALKEAGLNPQKLSVPQLRAVFEKLMPKELEARGVTNATATCKTAIEEIVNAVSAFDLTASESPDDIFKRLGGG